MNAVLGALSLLFVADGMPATWEGVWVDAKGTFVVLSGKSAHFMVSERQAFGFDIEKVPDGYYRGQWLGSREIAFTDYNSDQKFLINHIKSPGRGSGLGGSNARNWPMPFKASSVADVGEFFVQPGAIGSAGEVKYLDYRVTDGNGATKLSGALYPSMLLSALSIKGKFAGNGVSVDLADSNGIVSGSFKTSTATYVVSGTRFADRASLDLVAGATGRKVGKIAVSWSPSPDVAKLGRGKLISTDQITASIQCPDFPSGALRGMRRE